MPDISSIFTYWWLNRTPSTFQPPHLDRFVWYNDDTDTFDEFTWRNNNPDNFTWR